MLRPGERVAEGDTARIVRQSQSAGARIEDGAIGPEHERRDAHALGDARIGGAAGLVDADLVIGQYVGERLQIAPRIARGTLGGDEHAVTGLPGNRATGTRADERDARSGASRRLGTDDEAAPQGVGIPRRGASGEEHPVLAVLAQAGAGILVIVGARAEIVDPNEGAALAPPQGGRATGSRPVAPRTHDRPRLRHGSTRRPRTQDSAARRGRTAQDGNASGRGANARRSGAAALAERRTAPAHPRRSLRGHGSRGG